MSRRLVVSPYPPWRDGIGAYALAQVRHLRRCGDTVEVCSPEPSAAHHHVRLSTVRGIAELARLGRRFDETVVHFHPSVFYPRRPSPLTRLANGVALAAALRAAAPVELLIHELPVSWATGPRPWAAATRLALRAAATVSVHDDAQRTELVEAAGLVPARVRLVEHGAHFTARTSASRASARSSLGIGPNVVCFVCIGFVAPHKGFDRAVEAFAAVQPAGTAARAELHVVGTARTDGHEADAAVTDHVARLRRLVESTPGAHLHLGFVSDEQFDRWLLAADAVVLPYREIWSSSVAARAALLGRPVIASAVGGLAAQLSNVADAVLVGDDGELKEAMAAVVRSASTASRREPPAGGAGAKSGGHDGASALRPASPSEPTPADATLTAPDGDLAEVAGLIRRRAEAARGGERGSEVHEPPPLDPAATASRRSPLKLAKGALRRLRRATMEAIDERTTRRG